MKFFMNLPHYIFMYLVTFALWNFMLTFCILFPCIWSPLPYKTLHEPFAVYLHQYRHLYLYPIKLYRNLPHFIFMYIFTVTLSNVISPFRILFSCICSPLPYEALYKPSTFYFHVNGDSYPMKLYMNILYFILICMVIFSL